MPEQDEHAVRPAGSQARAWAWAVLGTGIALEIAYPLTDGTARSRLSVAIVALMCTAAVASVAARFGTARAGAALALSAGIGFAAEVAGTATDYPFGSYEYTGGLGPSVASVPLIVGLAWTMGALPAYAAAARVARNARGLTWILTAAGLAAWDVFLDPQMVADGRWAWEDPQPHLPGVPGVPLTNFAGWLLVAGVVAGALSAVLRPTGRAGRVGLSPSVVSVADPAQPDSVHNDTVHNDSVHNDTVHNDTVHNDSVHIDQAPVDPAEAQFLWVYASSVLAHAAFLDLAGSAAWGGAAMGLVAVPLAVRLARGRIPLASPRGSSPRLAGRR